MSDLEQKIQRLEDLDAIRTLVHRYAHLVWSNKPLDAVDLFAVDGVVDMGPDGGLIEGKESLREIYKDKVNTMLLHPFIHNHIIDLNGDEASGIAYLDLRCVRDGESLMGSGYYEDRYVREAGEWKFKVRKLTMCYLVPPTAGWESHSHP
jgi:hypothetical protein